MNAQQSGPRFAWRSWWQGLVSGEEATASTEMVILLPVYLLFMVGLFWMGNVMLVRQVMISDTRNFAWDPNAQVPQAGGGPYNLQIGMQVTESGEGVAFRKTQITSADLPQQVKNDIREICIRQQIDDFTPTILAALNNTEAAANERVPFQWRVVDGTYTYNGLNLQGAPPNVQKTSAAVLLPRDGHKRSVYKEPTGASSDAQHFIARWPGATLDPSAEGYRPLSPNYATYFEDGIGIWNVKARVKGDMESEHSYFEGKVSK